ncbi:MAG: hypothetical protein H8E15_02110 [Planctomycetes bacterium]|nr:hypothetical protein [Planctomycetota bacterium]
MTPVPYFGCYHGTDAARREMQRLWGKQTSVQLGQLLLINAIHAGLRISDGNKYMPSTQWLDSDSSETRARIRRLLPAFLEIAAAADAEPGIANLADGPWDQIWHDPLAASSLAVALIPGSNQARLTLAVNQLRRGTAKPALFHLQTALANAALSPSARSQFQRNLAACYEVIGDDDGAIWFAERAIEVCPWSENSLFSYLIYSVVAPGTELRLPKMEQICRKFPGPFQAGYVWSILKSRGGRASTRLQADPDLAIQVRDVIHSIP